MRPSTLLAAAGTALASATPITTNLPGNFSITHFHYGSPSTTSDWAFSMAVHGHTPNHPGFVTPVTCSGNMTTQDFTDTACGPVVHSGKNQAVSAYITKCNELKLQYEIFQPENEATFWYEGHKHVYPETSGKKQAEDFIVEESSAHAIAE